VNQKPIQHVIHISNPDVSKPGMIIALELTEEGEAIMVAQMLARETGRRVTVRDTRAAVTVIIPAADIH
jgi:hypothetical protein